MGVPCMGVCWMAMKKKPATLFRFQLWWIFKTSNSLGASSIDRISPYFSLVDSQGILGSCVDQGAAIWALVFEKSPRCQLRMRLATKSVAFRHQRWLPIIYSFPLPCWEVSPLCWWHFLMKHLMWTIHFQAQSSIINHLTMGDIWNSLYIRISWWVNKALKRSPYESLYFVGQVVRLSRYRDSKQPNLSQL